MKGSSDCNLRAYSSIDNAIIALREEMEKFGINYNEHDEFEIAGFYVEGDIYVYINSSIQFYGYPIDKKELEDIVASKHLPDWLDCVKTKENDYNNIYEAYSDSSDCSDEY